MIRRVFSRAYRAIRLTTYSVTARVIFLDTLTVCVWITTKALQEIRLRDAYRLFFVTGSYCYIRQGDTVRNTAYKGVL